MPALPPESDKPRVVARYQNVRVIDVREKIWVQFDGKPHKSAAYYLRLYGFRHDGSHGFEAPNNPRNIFTAQDVLNTWCGKEIAP